MQTTILDSVALIKLDVSLWEGRKKLQQADLKAASGELPPEEVASLGSKKIIHPSVINEFNRIKQRVKKQLLDRVGTRFLGGWAVPLDCLDEVMQEIEKERAAFYEARRGFLDNYQERIEEWVSAHPEWARIIRNAVPPKDEPARQLQFEYSVIKVAPVTDQKTGDPVHDRVNQEAERLGSRTLQEVAEQAQEIWSRIQGESRVTQNSAKGVYRLVEKLRGWSMIEPRAYHLVEQADQALAEIPKNGPIEGAAVTTLHGLVLLLADPQRAQGHMQSAQPQADDGGIGWMQPTGAGNASAAPDDSPAASDESASDDPEPDGDTDLSNQADLSTALPEAATASIPGQADPVEDSTEEPDPAIESVPAAAQPQPAPAAGWIY